MLFLTLEPKSCRDAPLSCAMCRELSNFGSNRTLNTCVSALVSRLTIKMFVAAEKIYRTEVVENMNLLL
jgi:hypothetical protein